MRFTTSVLLASSLVVAASCSGDRDDEATTTTSPPTTAETGAGTTAATSAPPPDAMTIGFLNPPAGLLDELAQAQTAGMSLAATDINGGGGAVRVVTVAEAAEDPTATVDAVADAGITMLVGPVSSSAAASLRSGLAAADVVTCSASATADALTVAEEGDETPPGRFVRTALPDMNTVSFVADHLAERRGQAPADQPWPVAVVTRSDDYGMSVGGGLVSALAARGIEATVVDYNPRTVIFTNEVAEVTSLGPGAVVLVSYEEGVPLLRSLITAGLPATEVVGLDGLVTPRLAERTFPDDLSAIDGITLIGSTGNRAFLQRMADDASITELIYGAQAYDCAVALALAAEAAGSTEAADIAAALPTVTAGGQTCSSFKDCVDMLRAGEDIDYDGPSGRIAFAPNGDPTSGRFTTGTSEAGDLVELSSEDIDLATQARDQTIVAEAAFVTQLQLALRLLGFYQGPIDGILDEEVTAAIAAFQTSVGLPATGAYDAATDEALRARAASMAGGLGTTIAGLQQALADLGFYDGPIDGTYSAATVAAVQAFQTALGVEPTGMIDVATMQAIYQRGITTGAATTAPPPPAPTTTPTTAPPPTAATTTVAPLPEPGGDLWQVLQAQPELSEFVAALRSAGFQGDFSDSAVYTVFAPVNDAFASATLPTDPEDLAELLANHVVEGRLAVDDLETGPLTTITGALLAVERAGNDVTVGGATIVEPTDLAATNGVIQAVDALVAATTP